LTKEQFEELITGIYKFLSLKPDSRGIRCTEKPEVADKLDFQI
jgi:hypothetical protein